jgi:hypothetical protein
MEGERIAAALEAGKLFVFLADGSVIVGRFADDASASRVFSLPGDRVNAIDALTALASQVGGGTRYFAGLRPCPNTSRGIIFLSDGRADDHAEALQFIRDKIRCPVYAVAYQADDQAFELLSRMAAASRGAAYNIATGQQLAEAFLAIHEQVRQSRRAEGRGRLVVPQVSGELLAISFSAEPQFAPSLQSERHVASLAGGKIHAARIVSSSPQDVTVSLPTGHERDRLIVVRYDLLRAVTRIEDPVFTSGRAELQARTRFLDQGKLFDPRGAADLEVRYELLDPAGKATNAVQAQVVADQPEYSARVPVAAAVGETGWQLRTTTIDSSQGVPFVETHLRALEIEKPPTPKAPPSDLLHLRVIAHRSTAVVLHDTRLAGGNQSAMVGDRLSLELSAGPGLSEPELFTLGRSLRAEFISEDGAIRRVPLEYREGRYVTSPVPVLSPGKLKVMVNVNVQDAEINISGVLEILEPQWQLLLDDPCRGLGVLPRYATVPYQVRLACQLGNRRASRDELMELLTRDGLQILQTRADSGGRTLKSRTLEANVLLTRPGEATVGTWFCDLGEQNLAFTLRDKGGQVLAEAIVKLRVVPSPIDVQVTGEATSSPAEWSRWLPDVFCHIERARMFATAADSQLSRDFYIAGVELDDRPLDWGGAGFQADLAAGEHQLRARLEPYRVARTHVGPAEIQLLIPLKAGETRTVNWQRVVLAFVGGITCLLLLIWLVRVASVLSWDRCTVSVGLAEDVPLPLRWRWSIWPQSCVWLYRQSDTPLEIASYEQIPAGAEVVGRIDRVGRRRVRLRLFHESGDSSVQRLDPCDCVALLSDDETLIVTFGLDATPAIA